MVMSCPERASTIEVHWYSVNPCSSRGKGGRTLMTTYDKQAGRNNEHAVLLLHAAQASALVQSEHARTLPFVSWYLQGRHGAAVVV